jgi:hypothetical protein
VAPAHADKFVSHTLQHDRFISDIDRMDPRTSKSNHNPKPANDPDTSASAGDDIRTLAIKNVDEFNDRERAQSADKQRHEPANAREPHELPPVAPMLDTKGRLTRISFRK